MFSCYKKLFFPSPPSIESSDSLTVPRRHKIFIAFEWREPATSTSHRVKGQKDAFLVQRLFERSSQTCSTYIIQSFDLYKGAKTFKQQQKYEYYYTFLIGQRLEIFLIWLDFRFVFSISSQLKHERFVFCDARKKILCECCMWSWHSFQAKWDLKEIVHKVFPHSTKSFQRWYFVRNQFRKKTETTLANDDDSQFGFSESKNSWNEHLCLF